MKTVAMSGSSKRVQNAIIVGGGIGGLAAALALARQGISVDLLEAASEIGEIGAGIQLAANAFNALDALGVGEATRRSEEHTSELQSLMRISYAVFCLKKKNNQYITQNRILEKQDATRLLETNNK